MGFTGEHIFKLYTEVAPPQVLVQRHKDSSCLREDFAVQCVHLHFLAFVQKAISPDVLQRVVELMLGKGSFERLLHRRPQRVLHQLLLYFYQLHGEVFAFSLSLDKFLLQCLGVFLSLETCSSYFVQFAVVQVAKS